MTQDKVPEVLKWTGSTYAIISVFSVIGALLFIGTFLDILSKFSPYRSKLSKFETTPESFTMRALKSFSLYTNMTSLLSTKKLGADRLDCLDGIRFISMSWVILGHSFLFQLERLQVNNPLLRLEMKSALYTERQFGGMSIEAITNATNKGPMDTFFLIGAVLG